MKKAICGVLLALCLLAGLVPAPALAAAAPVWDGSVAEDFAGGSGTEEDPYQIADGAQLALLAQQANDGDTDGVYYVLTRDIDLGGLPWTPIGTYQWAYCTFEGCFDGGFHRITGLFVDASVTYADTDEVYAGLFGYVDCGMIRDLAVSGTVQSTRSAHPTVGGVAGNLVGESYTIWNESLTTVRGSVVSGCSFSGSVTVTAKGEDDRDGHAIAYAGGIAGFVGNKSAVMDCRNDGAVTCNSSHESYTGGVAGLTRNLISRCVNNGDVTSVSDRAQRSHIVQWDSNCAGGIAGVNVGIFQSAAIEACMNTGSVTARGGSITVGGVAGTNYLDYGGNYNAAVRSCCSTGPVTGSGALDASVGGVAGSVSNGTQILNCYSAGSVAGGDGARTGGVVGLINSYSSAGITLENCYAAGPVSGGEGAAAGGFLGACSEYDKYSRISLSGCFCLRAEGQEAVGDSGVWYDALDVIKPLSAGDFGKKASFGGWDWDVWKMAKDLDPGVSPVTARPVLKDPDESATEVPVRGISLDERALTLAVGEKVTLTATVLPEDASDKTVLWGSSDEAVVTADQSGVVTAVAAGTARIAAAAGDRGAACTVTVVPARITAISLTEEKAEVSVLSGTGGTAVLAACHWYDRCLAVKVLPLEAGKETVLSLDLPEQTGPVRLFLLDSGGAPLTGAVELHEEIPGRR